MIFAFQKKLNVKLNCHMSFVPCDVFRSEWNLNTGQNTNMVFAIPMMTTTPIVVANTSALMTNHGGLPRELMESHQRTVSK